MQEVTPRVNSVLLPRNIGRTVRLVGKVLKLDPLETIIEAPDGGQVLVKLLPGGPQITDTFVEVIATVQDATTLKSQYVSNIGDSIDLKVVDSLIDLTQRHPQIFGAP